MKNFLLWLTVLALTLVIIVVAAGRTVGGDFKYESNVIFDDNKDLLWYVINNVDAYPKNKYGIVSLEKKEYQGDTLIKWRENFNFGVSKDYEILRKKDPEILVLKIKNNFTGMNTTLTFQLSEDDSKTYLKINEESVLNNVLYRGLKVLSGQDSYVNSQIKWIRVSVYNYLINK